MSLELLYGVGALALLAVIVWGYVQYKSRNRANDPITEAATREEYDHPDTYREAPEALKREIRPS